MVHLQVVVVSTKRQGIQQGVRGDLMPLFHLFLTEVLPCSLLLVEGCRDTLQLLLYKQDAEGHHDTAHSHIGALPFTNSGAFPKYSQ